jgi:hypothetical protein
MAAAGWFRLSEFGPVMEVGFGVPLTLATGDGPGEAVADVAL